MIKAVIFDMDGVISQTAHLQAEIESKLLKKLGINITAQEIVNQYSGQPDRVTFIDTLEKNGVKADVDDLLRKKWAIMEKEMLKGIKAVDGVKTFIVELLSNKLLLAVASGSSRSFIEHVLNALQLRNDFQVIVSGDEVKRGKPDPELFITAANKLHVMPSECIVIEDARNGVEAARKGNMKVIAITTTHKRQDLIEAHKIIDSFREVNAERIRGLFN